MQVKDILSLVWVTELLPFWQLLVFYAVVFVDTQVSKLFVARNDS